MLTNTKTKYLHKNIRKFAGVKDIQRITERDREKDAIETKKSMRKREKNRKERENKEKRDKRLKRKKRERKKREKEEIKEKKKEKKEREEAEGNKRKRRGGMIKILREGQMNQNQGIKLKLLTYSHSKL